MAAKSVAFSAQVRLASTKLANVNAPSSAVPARISKPQSVPSLPQTAHFTHAKVKVNRSQTRNHDLFNYLNSVLQSDKIIILTTQNPSQCSHNPQFHMS